MAMVSVVLYRFRGYCDDWECYELSAIDADQRSMKDIGALTIGSPPRPMVSALPLFPSSPLPLTLSPSVPREEIDETL